MDKYVTQHGAAAIIGISPARLCKIIKQGRFIKGKLLFNKHAAKEVIQYRVKDVEKYAKNRVSLSGKV